MKALLRCSLALSTALVVAAQPSTQPAPANVEKDTAPMRAQCASNLKQLYVICLLHANEYRNAFPQSMGEIYLFGVANAKVAPSMFLCPDASAVVPADWSTMDVKAKAAWVAASTSYVYEGNGLKNFRMDDVILMSEKPGAHSDGTHVVFADGRVELITNDNLAAVRAKSDDARAAK